MTSFTTWQRLEPLPRSADLRPGLRAEIADPLWLLARQRQVGELRGEDAGSPVEARFEASAGRLSRVHRGVTGSNAALAASDHDDRALPLEVVVERERVRGTPAGGGLAVEAGLHFARLLRARRVARHVRTYLDHYALADADLPGDDAITSRLRRRAAGRVIDGSRLHTDLAAARGQGRGLTALPAEPPIPAADHPRVLAAANAFLAWWDGFLSEPGDDEPSSWVSRRMEHSFAAQATLPSGRAVVHASEYRGGRLDWHSFTLASQPDLGTPEEPRDAEHLVRTVLPSPVAYGGMPADRFWEIEDGTVRFGALAPGRTELARMMLAEFALVYGNDWFVVPIDLPVGSVCSVEQLTVVDTFGEAVSVTRSTDGTTGPSRLFEVDAPDGPARVAQLFVLAPALAETSESAPLEEVALLRDEMANVVWGVERRYQGAAGEPVDRYEEHQRRVAVAQRVDTDMGDAQLLYRLATDVPYHWYPFVPVRAAGVAPTAGVVQLERRPLVRVLADGSTEVPEPLGRVLTDADPLRIEEEEVPRSGTDVVRRYQLARWTDGRYVVWCGRQRLVGGGEGSSGLRFDVVGPVVG